VPVATSGVGTVEFGWSGPTIAALVGGMIFAAVDTGGRPSIFWSGRRAAEDFVDAVDPTSLNPSCS
jgi:hypothetical protein